MSAAIGLAALEVDVHRDLGRLDQGRPDWTRPRADIFDVIIVGGGQSGLGAGFGLLRERVSNILILDENPAGREGPWDSYARMHTLRTPKSLTAIDYGVPSLTFRAYWEAQHGADGWATLDKIPRRAWMDYLRWYRRVLALPVRNDSRVERIAPDGPGRFRLDIAGQPPLHARKVVLATGIQGGGEWHVPAMVADALPARLYAHTSQSIDYAARAGRRIAILGGGASAFDNADAALSAGAAEVHVFLRRAELPRVNPIRHMERAGMIGRYAALDDAAKYRVMAWFFACNQPPTADMFERAAAWPGFRLHLGCPWRSVAEHGDGVSVDTADGRHQFDFLVLSTGLVTEPALRSELRGLAAGIARWGDRYRPPADIANPLIDAHPYLGAGFELQGRTAADAARLHGLFAFNYSALISLGLSASALSGLQFALPKLVAGIANQLFLDDKEAIIADYLAFDEPEFLTAWPPAPADEAGERAA